LPETAITPGASEPGSSAAPAVPTDQAGASSRKSDLLANPEWRSKFLENDPAARAEMSAINRVLVGPGPAEAPVEALVLDHAREIGVSEAVVEQIQKGEPISQFEHDTVSRWKAAHLKDPAFLRKYFDGDYDARQKMFLANVTLSLPIKQA
jgi:hypothetical protein